MSIARRVKRCPGKFRSWPTTRYLALIFFLGLLLPQAALALEGFGACTESEPPASGDAVFPGRWFNPERLDSNLRGHGIDLYRNELQNLVLTWYTYDLNGNPVWYQALKHYDDGDVRWTAPLYEFNYVNPPQRGATLVGEVTLQFLNNRRDLLNFSWTLNSAGEVPQVSASRTECLHLHSTSIGAAPNGLPFEYSGLWGPKDTIDQDWGLLVTQDSDSDLETLAIYDANGWPVWVQDVDIRPPAVLDSFSMLAFKGFCPACAVENVEYYGTGGPDNLTRYFQDAGSGWLTANIDFPAAINRTGTWSRNRANLTRITIGDQCLGGPCEPPPDRPPPPGPGEGFGACDGNETPGSGDQVSPGRWWNEARVGHGIDLYQSDAGNLVLTWYTYDIYDNPVWYQATAPYTSGSTTWTATLREFHLTPDNTPAADKVATIVGEVTLEFLDNNHESFNFIWTLDEPGLVEQWLSDAERTECYTLQFDTAALNPQPDPAAPGFEYSGHWYALDPDDEGWGLNITQTGADEIDTLAIYDANGLPVWVQGSEQEPPDETNVLAMYAFKGYCVICPDPNPEPGINPPGYPAGSIDRKLQNANEGTLEAFITFPSIIDRTGQWNRSLGNDVGVPIQRLTEGDQCLGGDCEPPPPEPPPGFGLCPGGDNPGDGDQVVPGRWYNPARDGNGMDLYLLDQSDGDRYVVATWYTYTLEGEPVWYNASAPYEVGDTAWDADIYRFTWNHTTDTVNAGVDVGDAVIEFIDESATAFNFTWTFSSIIGDEQPQTSRQECYERLVNPTESGTPTAPGSPGFTYSGHWHNPDQPGWALNVTQSETYEITALAIYDADGDPVWVQGERPDGPDAGPVTLDMDAYLGFCVTCEPSEPVAFDAGSITREFTSATTGFLSTDINLPTQAIAAGGTWNRNHVPIVRFTHNEACLGCGLPEDPETPPPPAAKPMIDPADLVASSRIGATPGAFKVDRKGAATYTIPIKTVPGSGGLEPRVALHYDSQAGLGSIGLRWSVSGLGAITRCRQTIEQDGETHPIELDPIDPQRDSYDRFCLNGQRLMLVSGDYGDINAVYKTEINTHVRVFSHGSIEGGPAYFVVEAKDGSTTWYGGTSQFDHTARIFGADGAVLTWAKARFEDSAGNYIEYEYNHPQPGSAEYNISDIHYTGNRRAGTEPFATIHFAYTTNHAQERSISYIAGTKITNTRKLVRIDSKVGAQFVRSYHLGYQQGPLGRSLL